MDGFSCRSLRLTFWSHVLLSNVRALVSKCSIFSHGETVVLTLAQVWLLAKSCAMPLKAKAVAKRAKSKAEALAWAGLGILILPWQHFKGFFGLQKRIRILVQFLGSLLGASSVPQSTRALDQGGVEPRQAVSPKALRPWTIPLRYSVGWLARGAKKSGQLVGARVGWLVVDCSVFGFVVRVCGWG